MKPRAPRRWPRRLAIGTAVVGAGYVYDRQFNASAITRSLRTGYIGVLCTLDCEFLLQSALQGSSGLEPCARRGREGCSSAKPARSVSWYTIPGHP
jgi:hypothetical protein